MNQILLRTNKGEYNPGEDIYGVVYLSIVNPTAGQGVKLMFRGNESFLYETRENATDKDNLCIKSNKDYIDCRDVTLFTDPASLMLGNYVCPFHFKLLSDLPGSFMFEGKLGATWEGRVRYWLEAEVINAQNIKVAQSLVIHHDLPRGLGIFDTPPAVCVTYMVSSWFLFVKKIFLTARLMSNTWQTGDTIRLRLILTNNTRINVQGFIIRLLRRVLLKSGKTVPVGCGNTEIQHMACKTYVEPEGGTIVVWEKEVCDCSQNILNKGLDNILIPLVDGHETAVPPTVYGHHIECKYFIEVVTKFSDGGVVELIVPVSRIVPKKNEEWHSWNPPNWVYNCAVKTYQGPFCVSENVLGSEAFSGIPGFQIL